MFFDMLISIRIWFEKLITGRDYGVEPADIEDVTAEYSQECLEELERGLELAKLEYERGETMTIEEIMTTMGLKRSWWRGWVKIKT